MNVLVISTGGTIASTANARGALVPTLTGEELVDRCGTTRQVRAIDVASLDSSSMGLAEIDMLRETVRTSLLDDSASLVITHGTDSMAETALALDLVHADPRPVVLTGAMRSADHARPDGPANLRGAIEVAASRRDTGVLVHSAGETLPARGLMKTQTTAEHAFTLTSGSPLPRPMAVPPAPLAGLNIPIIRAWAGADDALIRALGPIDGLVLEALGSGNVSACMGGAVAKLLRRGVPVVVATSVPYGEVSFAYGGAGGGSTLGDLGALPAGYLSASQARIALATALASGVNPSSLL
ncbi:asparaginase [Corynebacterium haemomassiliense]|uniref:asparaginase n=1 Tax=Corynebacterium haemomassiliense TaxID=2754726 RepID=A0A7W2I3H0_9CORY|nr:asparaginase [Corynebacterium haemomassiliense]MBA5244054.1 asparaginase [Corynebacterium haemomassiliense]